MYESILVPLDGSMFGEHALPSAASIARRAGARLTIAYVHEPAATFYGEGAVILSNEVDAHARQQKQAYLERVVTRFGNAAPKQVAPLLLEGDVVEAIRGQVAKDKADLVVMTTHGRGPLGRFWLGSVADKLLRQLSIPLLLVHPGHRARPSNGVTVHPVASGQTGPSLTAVHGRSVHRANGRGDSRSNRKTPE
jgi:nucleotide-binding universal stress UspA family protein